MPFKTSLKLVGLVLISLQVTSVLAVNRAHVAAVLNRELVSLIGSATTTASETSMVTGSPQRQCRKEGDRCGGHDGGCCEPYQCNDGDRGICIVPTCRRDKEKCGAQHGACCFGYKCSDGDDGNCVPASTLTSGSTISDPPTPIAAYLTITQAPTITLPTTTALSSLSTSLPEMGSSTSEIGSLTSVLGGVSSVSSAISTPVTTTDISIDPAF